MHGYDWPLGASVTVNIDDLDNGVGVDYTDTQTVIVAPWDPSTTVVEFPLDDFTLEPGQIITMTDGMIVKEHTVTEVTITAVDPVANTVNGTAAPGTDVYVDLCNDSGCEFQDVTADGSGIWDTTFTDIVAGDNVSAMQHDDDGDHTAFEWRVPSPWLEAYPVYDWVSGFDWPIGTTVDLDINSGAYTASGEVGVAPWDPNQTYVKFDLSGGTLPFDLQAGDVVQLSGNGTTKSHTVTALAVTDVNALTDTVSGTTNSPQSMWKSGYTMNEGSHVAVTPVGADWAATLPYDIVPGTEGAAVQNDADDDATWVNWRAPSPWIEVYPVDDRVDGLDWPIGTTVNLDINLWRIHCFRCGWYRTLGFKSDLCRI